MSAGGDTWRLIKQVRREIPVGVLRLDKGAALNCHWPTVLKLDLESRTSESEVRLIRLQFIEYAPAVFIEGLVPPAVPLLVQRGFIL